MNSNPFVSVIINCYNGERFLSEAIESVLRQTYSNWELIVWDNVSKDRSAEIALSYKSDPRIRYIKANKHTTLGEGRNLAATEARGEWIGFLDVDDLWKPEKLSSQIGIIEENDGCALVYCRAEILGGPRSGQDYSRYYPDQVLPEGNVLPSLLLVENFIPLVSAILTKKAFIEVGGIPLTYKQSEDYYLFCAVASRYTVKAWQATGCYYRQHSGNLSKSQQVEEVIETIDVLRIFNSNLSPQLQAMNEKNIASLEQRLSFLRILKWNHPYKSKPLAVIREVLSICLRKLGLLVRNKEKSRIDAQFFLQNNS
jgi:glycosyltransferase involved in cell wall biosynthesis